MRDTNVWVVGIVLGTCLMCGREAPARTVAGPEPSGAARATVEVAWRLDAVPGMGFEGSPAHCDLDGDGRVEAVVPIGSTFPPDRSYIEVVDPATGARRFRTAEGEAGFGHPLCRDVDADGVLDIITAGRMRDVRALSGVDGRRLWALADSSPGAIRGNTYTPVSTPEHPGLLFVSTGGGGEAPGGPTFPGSLLALGTDGKLLARWDEPNGAEIYSSPALLALDADDDVDDDGPSLVLAAIGSGGEFRPGSLHLVVYDLRARRFRRIASLPSACDSGGFIASPVIGDVTGDGWPEVVAADYCGTVSVLTARGRVRWRRRLDQPFITGNPLLVDLDGDAVLDVVAVGSAFNFSLPYTWASLDSVAVAFRGGDGVRLWSAAVGRPVISSPVSADLDQDGVEDVWLAEFHAGVLGPPLPSQLLVLSGADGSQLLRHGNVNWAGTPMLGDADGDGSLDALVIDAPASPEALPATTLMLEFPGVRFEALRSFSGFRGPHHDGRRR